MENGKVFSLIEKTDRFQKKYKDGKSYETTFYVIPDGAFDAIKKETGYRVDAILGHTFLFRHHIVMDFDTCDVYSKDDSPRESI